MKECKKQTGGGKISDNMREQMPNWVGYRWLRPQKCRAMHSSTLISITQVAYQSRKTGQFCGYWSNIHFEQGMGKISTWDACERNGRVRNRR